MKCATCRHFGAVDSYHWLHDALTARGMGACHAWREGYRDDHAEMKANECWVENDEGWGNVVGPEFGCVLWEPPIAQS